MWNRKELKAQGKEAFKANYWRCVLVALITVALAGGIVLAGGNRATSTGTGQETSLTEILEVESPEVVLAIFGVVFIGILIFSLIAAVISAFLFNPLKVGCARFFLVNTGTHASLSELSYGYESNYWNMVKTLILRDVFLFLWGLLFVIPGIIKAYSYRMVPYILAENPDIGSREAITLSREMMRGNKWRSFVLDLSFLGWYLLAAITMGLLGVFYVEPYRQSTDAELYRAIKGNS